MNVENYITKLLSLSAFSFSLMFHHVKACELMHVFHYHVLGYCILLREGLIRACFAVLKDHQESEVRKFMCQPIP